MIASSFALALLTLGAQGAPAQTEGATPRAILRHRIGVAFELAAEPSRLRVLRVEPDEAGEAAGLLPGDILMTVAGVEGATLTAETLPDHFSRSGPIPIRLRRAGAVVETTLYPRPAPLAEREVVALHLDTRHRVPVFETTLAGQSVRLLLHTGTQQSWVTPATFERLGRPVPKAGERAELGPLRFGHLELTGRTFGAESRPLPGLDCDGALALDDLSPLLVSVEYADHFLALETGALPPADGQEILDYFVCEDTGPAVSIDIAGWKFDVHLDSSLATGVALGSEYIDKLPTTAPPTVMGRVVTDDTAHDMLGAELVGSVRIGRHELSSPGLRFSEAFEHANLGPDALAEFTLTFDTVLRRVRFQRRLSYAESLLSGAAATPSLDAGGAALRAAFEADRGRPRLLLLLSPT